MALQLPRLVHTTPIADKDNKPTRELTRFWDRAMSAIENSLRAISTGIVVSKTESGEVITRTITAGTGISIGNGTGISGNPTVSLGNTAVTAGNYGDASHVGTYTVDAQGRLTAAGNVSIVLPLTSAHLLVGNASGKATDVALTGDATINNAGVLSLAANISFAGKTLNGGTLTSVAVDIASGSVLKNNGTQVVGAQGAAVADASGGATIDAEARTAINTLLARLRAHGIIAT